MRHFIAILSKAGAAMMTLLLSFAFLMTANYLLQHMPQRVSARLAKENAAAVRAAQDIYASSGCSTINGQRPPNLSYLHHVDCDCQLENVLLSDAAAAP